MSIFNRRKHLSVGPFSDMPAIAGLPAIARPSASVTASVSGSVKSATFDVINRDERCLITKSLLYTHERAHWISAVRSDAGKKVEIEKFIIDLGIVDAAFELDDASNLANLDRVIHKCLDSYALIAVTGASETLRELTKMLKVDNNARQLHLDQRGVKIQRRLDFSNPSFLNPRYELVVLHPEHFLPVGSVLTCYDPAQIGHKTYVPSPYRRLRESPGDLARPPFPPFSGPNRRPGAELNPFLVIINAEIKFRRYHRLQPPSQSLPEDVLELIKQTEELVELIYWEPEVKPGSYAEQIEMTRQASRKRNAVRTARPQPGVMQESDEEIGMSSDAGHVPTIRGHGPGRRRARAVPWPEGADLSTRIAMGTALISGHNLEYTSEDEDFLESLHSHNDGNPSTHGLNLLGRDAANPGMGSGFPGAKRKRP
ncbi:hypothetical protein BDZ97DRAFT_1924481 [Flammula alnicola]|nr:hypothetical protein BDZ97DRAFT_1924481 [Flammula alnicola]